MVAGKGQIAIGLQSKVIIEQPVVIAAGQLTALAIAVSVIVLGVTGASAPWLRIARKPELLREA